MGTDLVDGDSLFLVGFYPNHVDRDIISEMRSAHGKDRQHATIVGRGIDRIVSRDPVIDSSRSVGVASYRPSFVPCSWKILDLLISLMGNALDRKSLDSERYNGESVAMRKTTRF